MTGSLEINRVRVLACFHYFPSLCFTNGIPRTRFYGVTFLLLMYGSDIFLIQDCQTSQSKILLELCWICDLACCYLRE